MKFNLSKISGVSTLVLASIGSAMADGTFTVPTSLTDSQTNVALVGAAVFTIAVGVKLYKWLKSAL